MEKVRLYSASFLDKSLHVRKKNDTNKAIMKKTLSPPSLLLNRKMDRMLRPFVRLASCERLEELLREYVTEKRKDRIWDVMSRRLPSFRVACESPTDIHNALAIVRTAESLGVTNISIIDHELKKNEGRGTMQGADVWSDISFHKNLAQFQNEFLPESCSLVGFDPHATLSIDEISVEGSLCFLFGNEHRGLSDEAKKRCDILCKIPMYGMTESYNLSVSAALALYECTERKRRVLEGKSDVHQEELLSSIVWAYIKTIGPEPALKIAKRYLEGA